MRGEAKLAAGDIEGARADLEAAQKLAPKLETAIVGRAWVELAAGDPDAAHKQLGDLADKSASPAVVTVNAAILRRDPTTRDKAKTNLEAIVGGAPGPDVARAELELARVYHDLGDFAAARKAYAAASQTGNFDARLESGLLMIEDRDPPGGATRSTRCSRKRAITRPRSSCSRPRARACSPAITRARPRCSRRPRPCRTC